MTRSYLIKQYSSHQTNEKAPDNSQALFVRVKGLEPIRRKAPDPKSGLSTNSNTPAWECKGKDLF